MIGFEKCLITQIDRTCILKVEIFSSNLFLENVFKFTWLTFKSKFERIEDPNMKFCTTTIDLENTK